MIKVKKCILDDIEDHECKYDPKHPLKRPDGLCEECAKKINNILDEENISLKTVTFKVVGISPLIVNRFTQAQGSMFLGPRIWKMTKDDIISIILKRDVLRKVGMRRITKMKETLGSVNTWKKLWNMAVTIYDNDDKKVNRIKKAYRIQL